MCSTAPPRTSASLPQRISANPAVSYAAPVQTVSQTQTVPNDLANFTSGHGRGSLNSTWCINAPAAWTVTTGSDQVIVADTDTGITYNDPDLYDNVWINQAEIPSSVLPNLTDVDDVPLPPHLQTRMRW